MPVRPFRKSTIKDVAARAGVSTTTVSNFVSGRENVCSAETARRIRAAVSALHYTPNSLSRSLHQRATRTIGVCMASSFDIPEDRPNEFFEGLWRGISKEADAQDYLLLHYPESIRSNAPRDGSVDVMLDGRVDGLIFNADYQHRRIEAILAAGMPVVILNRFLDLPAGSGAVHASESDTVDLALSHLWALGHRRIAHLAGPVNPSQPDAIAVQRRDGYIRWLTARGAYDPALLASGGSWYDNSPQAAQAVAAWRDLPDPATAAFCANDNLAVGVIAAAPAARWRVPEDLSVVGVDDISVAQYVNPPLTTVKVPLKEVGREALRALLRRMRGAPMEACRVAVPVTELVVRRSTAPPRVRDS